MTILSTSQPNLSMDKDRKTSFLVQQQVKGYTNNDPSPKLQKAIHPKLLQEMVQWPSSYPGLIAYHQLTIFAFFLAMHSCKYLKSKGEHQTQPLQLKSLVIF